MPRRSTSRFIKGLKKPLFKSSSTLTKEVNTLRRRVKKQESPFNLKVEQFQNQNIFTTATIARLDVAGSEPSTISTTKTLLKQIKISGQIVQTTASADTEIARIVIVMDKRKYDNNVEPVWADIFDNESIYSLRSDTLGGIKKASFQVLYDKTITVTNDTASLHNIKLFNYQKTWKMPIEQFNYSEYTKNLLYIMYISTANTGTMDLSWNNSVMMSIDQ